MNDTRTCLVTGATGYVGGRLAPRLLDRGHRVRALARTPSKLADAPWTADPRAEVVQGDLSDRDSLVAAFAGVDVVYHLVHSMSTDADFATEERRSAENVVAAAQECGVSRIVYLGGLHPEGTELSEHLASRAEVGDILIESPVETVALQAGTLIGSGSASFELIRHLTERLPAMTTPRWVSNKIQPIAVSDAMHYLVEAATAEVPSSRTWDIGGPDVLEYGDMMRIYAQVAGLRPRTMVVLPFLTPSVASRWVRFVTPIRGKIARPLIESLECDAVCRNRDIDSIIPRPPGGLTPYSRAVAETLNRAERGAAPATWAKAAADVPASEPIPTDPDWAGEEVFETSTTTVENGSADEIWDSLERRGQVVGENRPEFLRVRVSEDSRGNGFIEYALRDLGGDSPRTEVTTTCRFFPHGIVGLAYWRLGGPFRALGVPSADPFH
ncbi:NAD(P)H-binding protein [Gordonia amicalis]|uniref:NAD(P)H-binding protein n=1 Tax=Gordonia amicalis TaxID=89053 RepID=A0ABU4DCB8_9ACTN|nr:NAD(P)H-binding protein [Gordonia amicalis]MBA5847396.1 NAD(P)H-binding protein [Gordonia amicalis]MDV6307374.1 NAD(P)H-binding protein [Gordonia amicalis]MDV7101262.1 NAD(P)H-binding protein [Gordonia amicalis]MDV7175709.1 NAD(P)H-binding protein [Gordonia amicalis]NKX77545.1 SDR family oxidoreductase [Gordonia amicalis]